MYSTIRKKRCKTQDCINYPKLGFDGYCLIHVPQEIKDKVQTKTRKQQKQARQRLQNKVMNLKQVDTEAMKLELWFKLQMQANDRYCQNCGKSLYHYNDNDWRGSQHHIVDKSPLNGCPSVATNPLNHLVLCKWNCHQIWHQSFESASKMPVFQKAKEKFDLFKQFIAESELRKVNPYLYEKID